MVQLGEPHGGDLGTFALALPTLETAVRATHPFDSNRHPDTHTSKASGVVTLPPTDALLGGAAGFVGGGQV